MSWKWLALILLPLVFLTGCLEVHQQVTINPDRTAKVHVTMTFDLGLLERVERETGIDMAQETHEAEATMRSLARQCIATAKGVDAWTGYEMNIRPGQSISVQMTAYVRELTHFVLNPNNEEIPNTTFMVVPKEGKDVWTIVMPGYNDQSDEPVLGSLDDDEVRELLQERRHQFSEEMNESKALFEALHLRTDLRFAGSVTATENAERKSPQEASVTFEGRRYYAMMETILADDQLALRAFRQGAELHGRLALPGSQINAWLFGEKAPVTVTAVPGSRALFDYEKELAAAKASPPPEFPEDE